MKACHVPIFMATSSSSSAPLLLLYILMRPMFFFPGLKFAVLRAS